MLFKNIPDIYCLVIERKYLWIQFYCMIDLYVVLLTYTLTVNNYHCGIVIIIILTLLHLHKKKATSNVQQFVGSCLATKVFIGNLTAMGRGWVIIK